MVGVEAGLIQEKVTLTGAFGTGAARSKYGLEAMAIGGVGGYGFTERLDGFLRVGGAFSPSAFGKDKKATGIAGGVGVRYMLVGGRTAELGAFAEAGFISAVSNEAKLTVGNVPAAGTVRLDNLVNLTLGVGPQWWWRIGAQKYIFPSLAAFISPRFVGAGSFKQEGAGTDVLAKELADVEASPSQIVGFSAGVGLDLARLILRSGVTWLGAPGGGVSVEVPF